MNSTSRPEDSLLGCESLDVRVPGRQLVDSLNFELRRGELMAILGQNGAGKTLTLSTLAGLRPPDAGVVRLLGADITEVNRRQVARRLAVLPQVIDDIFPATVMDTALIGRHPHIDALGWESQEDYAAARAALQTTGLDRLAQRDIFTLSGGERRRLAIAQVLTQAPDIYLLDEPTNHLDPQHQLDTLEVFRRAADDGAGVIASVHDVNLAVRFADRCLLLFGDGRWQLGQTYEILDENTLGELYATQMEAVTWRSQKLFVPASGHPAA